MLKIAIDRGGTFTDIFAQYKEEVYTTKLLSVDPQHYKDATIEGVKQVIKHFNCNEVEFLRVGTTVATNALLEGKGEKFALLITKGFKDLLEIGYQNRPNLFELNIKKPKPIYSEVIEIDERIVNNKIIKPLNEKEVKNILKSLKQRGYSSIAVVFMHSYLNPIHELKVLEIAKELKFSNISISSNITKSIKIVDRGDTTLIDAYLTPVIKNYINSIKDNLKKININTKLQFMQSNGGLIDSNNFFGFNAILSGPAGGVTGISSIYKDTPIIGFDMGGTSTDVSRFDGNFELIYENSINNIRVKAPHLDIKTVAAGGGSRLFFEDNRLLVGPQSSGAHPGPVCYKKGGYLSITDANLLLNRIIPKYFPKIFGKNQNEPLDVEATKKEFEKLKSKIDSKLGSNLSIYEIALGFIEVANSNMAKPIKEMAMQKGFDLKEHILCSFGGAGGQHACAIAKELGIKRVLIHKYAGVFSAFGIAMADITKDAQIMVNEKYKNVKNIDKYFKDLIEQNIKYLDGAKDIEVIKILSLSYEGSDSYIDVIEPEDRDFLEKFKELHKQKFGFLSNRDIVIKSCKVRLIGITNKAIRVKLPTSTKEPKAIDEVKVYFKEGFLDTKVYNLETLKASDCIKAPAIILDKSSTILIEPGCKAVINEYGDIEIEIIDFKNREISTKFDPINVSIFANSFSSIATSMGEALRLSAISTNIKQRLDFSCAIFNKKGDLIANAPHIPVHLGSISQSVKYILKHFKINKNDTFITNLPIQGGSHLPDITLITPVVEDGKILYFVANRAHHEDIGGITPGSMPAFSTSLQQEGALIDAFKIVENGNFKEERIREILNNANARDIDLNIADIKAQIAANMQGIKLLNEMSKKYGFDVVDAQMSHLIKISKDAIQEFLEQFNGKLKSKDYLDDGIKIALKFYKKGKKFIFDFSKSSIETLSNQNAPSSITASTIVYALRVLINKELPLNEGFLKPIKIKHRKNSILNPSKNAAVVAGNVTTSQRVVDVILDIFGEVANSSGCMNNFSFGNEKFGYYETIAGGAGAGEGFDGASAVHTHMTNTRITDPEILENRYPVILKEFSIRKNSGGKGKYKGGDGVVRAIEFLEPMSVNLITQRRVFAPKGKNGGLNGKKGKNILIRNNVAKNLGSKAKVEVKKGDIIVIKTPGGGGYGE